MNANSQSRLHMARTALALLLLALALLPITAAAARAEYARMRREGAGTAEARLTETDFVRYHMDARPRPTHYLVAAALLLSTSLPAATALTASWPQD